MYEGVLCMSSDIMFGRLLYIRCEIRHTFLRKRELQTEGGKRNYMNFYKYEDDSLWVSYLLFLISLWGVYYLYIV